MPSNHPKPRLRRHRIAMAAAAPVTLAAVLLPAGSPASAGTAAPDPTQACVTPAPVSTFPLLHCYTPSGIYGAYGIDAVHSAGYRGAGQTIVLVDAYGTPTGANDINFFAKTFGLPTPKFTEVYPLGMPDYNQAPAKGNGLSGPASAAGWAGEATLDIEWADAIAPEANIVLLATPPAETEGVQGLPNMMKAIQWAIDNYPAGTVFSMSFGTDESTFGSSAATQFAKFDQTFLAGLRKGDTFFSSAGDSGSTAVTKQHKESTTSPYPGTSYPNVSPYVTSVGGTQLQYGWTWDPTSNVAYDSAFNLTPGYFGSITSGDSEAVWNESWIEAAGGGGVSSVYPLPAWQQKVAPAGVNHRMVPDLSWNAAVNGGVLCYETYPAAWNFDYPAWEPVGGTSAASPQVAALTALANQARTAAGQAPVGWLNPLLYTDPALGQSGTSSFDGTGAFRDTVPQTYGTASTGVLADNRQWLVGADGSVSPGPVPGYPVTSGYDLATGWGTPRAPGYIAALEAATPTPAP